MEDYRKSKNEELTDDEKDTISENINSVFNLKGHTLPVFDIKSDADEESVSDIFLCV